MTPSNLVSLELSDAVDDLAAPAYVIDRDGRFSWVNRAHIELFGDLRGRPFADYVVPEHRQLARTNFQRKVGGKTTQIFELDVFDRNGDRLTLRVTSAPLRRGGKVVGIFGVAMPMRVTSLGNRSPLADLTPRQQEVFRLLAEGLETPAIARRLGVAEETARNHIRALLRALGAHSRLEAVLMGFRQGLLREHLTHPGQQGDAKPADD